MDKYIQHLVATKEENELALKELQKAIDALVEIQDMGYGNGKIQRMLDDLNSLITDLE